VRFLSPGARKAIRRFDDRVDAGFGRARGNPVADRIFYAASDLGDFSLIWLLLGAARGLRSEHDWHAAVRVGGAVGLESLLVNVGIKSLVRRTRPPWETERPRRLRRPKTSSFPSGHATSAFMAATLLAEDDDLAPLYFAIAGVVAWSRVYVKIHHASDVVGGIAIGLVLGQVAKRIAPIPKLESMGAERA
jgi:membrane-associated phospholipid phosphatase